MSATNTLAQRLHAGPYRYFDERWQYMDHTEEDDGLCLGWYHSNVLDGYSYEEGVPVIAACPWATLEESDE